MEEERRKAYVGSTPVSEMKALANKEIDRLEAETILSDSDD